jgi:hypothetical protein
MTQTLEDLFWAYVDKNGPVVCEDLGPCWIWTGPAQEEGSYGRIHHGGGYIYAHRYALQREGIDITGKKACLLARTLTTCRTRRQRDEPKARPS